MLTLKYLLIIGGAGMIFAAVLMLASTSAAKWHTGRRWKRGAKRN